MPDPAAGFVGDTTRNALVQLRRGSYVAFRDMVPGPTYGRLRLHSLEPGAARLATALSLPPRSFQRQLSGVCLAIATSPAGFSATSSTMGMRVTQNDRAARLAEPHARVAQQRTRRIHGVCFWRFLSRVGTLHAGSTLDSTFRDDDRRPQSFAVTRDGKPFRAVDFNFGASRSRATRGASTRRSERGAASCRRGELPRTLRVIAEDIECPSLSPDEKAHRVQEAVRIGIRRLVEPAVVDLATMAVRQLPEPKHIDDQIEWLDDRHILYAVGHSTSAALRRADVWKLAIDGASPPAMFLADAESPAVVRR